MLAGCAARPVPPAAVAAAVVPVAAMPAVPKTQYGAFGLDTAGMDRNVAPGDDFFGFASGTWARNTPIPEDKSRYGMFNVLDDLSRERTRTIIEEQARDPNSRIGNSYASFMDTAAIEAKGLSPLQPWIDEIRAAKSKKDIVALYADADRSGVSIPFRMFVGQDRKASDRYALSMTQGGLGMPDRDYYLSNDPKLADTRAKYLQHLTSMLTLAGEANAAARAKAVVDFETKVAKVHWTRAESRNADKTYNKYTVAELRRYAPGFDFGSLAKGIGADVDYVIVAQPSSIKGIASLIGSTPLPVLKDQILLRSLDGYAAALPQKFDQENFAFYGTT